LRVLLDENMPHQLRAHLPDYDVSTAVYAGFGGFKNGELLTAAEAAGFDVLLTGDLSIEYQGIFPAARSPSYLSRRITGALFSITFRPLRLQFVPHNRGHSQGSIAENMRYPRSLTILRTTKTERTRSHFRDM